MNSIASDCREASMMEERAYEFRASDRDTVWKGKAVGMATKGRQRRRDQMGSQWERMGGEKEKAGSVSRVRRAQRGTRRCST